MPATMSVNEAKVNFAGLLSKVESLRMTPDEGDTLTLTGDCTLSVGTGATVSFADLTVVDGKTLAVEYADGIDSRAVRVATVLDVATLSRIKLNGRRAHQSPGGYLCAGGLMIIVK